MQVRITVLSADTRGTFRPLAWALLLPYLIVLSVRLRPASGNFTAERTELAPLKQVPIRLSLLFGRSTRTHSILICMSGPVLAAAGHRTELILRKNPSARRTQDSRHSTSHMDTLPHS